MLHWLHHQWSTYWWPSDMGNGPEAIQETVLVAFVGSLLYPPLRHYFKHELEKIHHKLDHVMSGTDAPYEEPEWEKFEHWISKLGKWVTRPFRKKAP